MPRNHLENAKWDWAGAISHTAQLIAWLNLTLIEFSLLTDDQNDADRGNCIHHLLAALQHTAGECGVHPWVGLPINLPLSLSLSMAAAAQRQRFHRLEASALRLVCIPLACHVAQLLQSHHLLLHECTLSRRLPTDHVPCARAAALLLPASLSA